MTRLLDDQAALPDPAPDCPIACCDRWPGCGRTCGCAPCFCPHCTERERRARDLRPRLVRHLGDEPAQTALPISFTTGVTP